MADRVSRRLFIRRTAGLASLPALAQLGAGCARRPSVAREVRLPCPADQRLVVAKDLAPELGRAGGAVQVLVHEGGVERAVLLANTGTGFVAVDGHCTHESCPVTWVQEDREVECPCHLSRFASDGTVLNPPAVAPLAAYPASLDAAGNVVVDLAPGDGIFPPAQNGQLQLDLASYPALQVAGGAVLGYPQGHSGPVVVARLNDGGIVAFDGTCTHLACAVHPAQPGVLHCPCHGSRFSISPDPSNPQRPQPAPGWVLAGPAGTPLGTFPSSTDGKTVTIRFPSACP